MKEIYEFIVTKYPYANNTLYSKCRTIYDLQSQSLFNTYLLNIKKRKVNSIPWVYYDLGRLKGKNFDIELFVINTSGDKKYKEYEYRNAKSILESKFNKATPYELNPEDNLDSTTNIINDNNAFDEKSKMNETLKKLNESYNKLKEDYQKLGQNHKKIIENYQKLNETLQQKNIELNNKIENLENKIKEINHNKNEYGMKYNNIDLEIKYNNLLFYFLIGIIIIAIVLFINIINFIYIICNKKDNIEPYRIEDSSLDIEKKQNNSNNEDEIHFK